MGESKIEKEKQKQKYSIWQNTAYMLQNAWHMDRTVIWLCIVVAVIGTAKATAELLIAPAILSKVEQAAPLTELLGVIALFAGTLFVLAGLEGYVNENMIFGRIRVRTEILNKISGKRETTAYQNLLDTEFLKKYDGAQEATSGNTSSAEAIWNTWSEILKGVFGLIIYLTMIAAFNPWMIVILAASAVLSAIVGKWAGEESWKKKEEIEEANKRFLFVIGKGRDRHCAKDIRMFGMQGWMEKIWEDGMSILGHFAARKEGILFGGDSAVALIHFVQNLLIYGYLIIMALNGEMSASQFLLYLGVAGGIGAWMDGILNQFNELHKQNGSLSSIRECIEWKEPFLFEEGKPLKKEQSACEIRLENVSFRYPEAQKDTISKMNLTIHPGEKLAIVGLNGAGKTTLVKLVCGFLDPTEGRVLLNGQDIRQYNRRDYYELFSAVFQDFSILECSVAENVSQNPVDIDRKKVKSCLEQAGIWEKIESLPKGMDTPLGKSVYEDGVELSGGQTQRLVLARALYKEPQILVLDEPTAALDPLAENDIYQRYESMTKGKTSLFISHRLASTQFCDRILFLANGQIKEEGTHQELLELGKEYAKLFEVQSRYYKEEVREDGE